MERTAHLTDARGRTAVPTGVLDHPDYLRPDRRPHYHWQDLYEWLPDGAAALEGFAQQCGDPQGWIPNMMDPSTDILHGLDLK